MALAQPAQTSVCLFLHAHLPFVRHPEHEDFLEEDWLFEAITETYLPLIDVMQGWVRDKIDARLTMSMSPTLCEMLTDELLMQRYRRRLDRLIELVHTLVRSPKDEWENDVHRMYQTRLERLSGLFDAEGQDIVGAVRRLMDSGVVEVATCAATHAFLPMFESTPGFARAQIKLGAQTHRRHFARHPPGIWLPECGYVPGLDRILADEGLLYFVVDAHAVRLANPAPVFGHLAPVITPAGVFAFPRHPTTSRRVWSAEIGYPGDFRYREYYRDAGFDLRPSMLGGLLLPNGQRRHTGIKRHRITGRGVSLEAKELYDRHDAMVACHQHAQNFSDILRYEAVGPGPHPPGSRVITAPYDAELFGHWWFEGPDFIDAVAREMATTPHIARLRTLGDVIALGADWQLTQPARSSWGRRGQSEVWLNERNDWVWPRLHRAVRRVQYLVDTFDTRSVDADRAVRQLIRSLCLASASDWPFMLTMGTTVAYAERRLRGHLAEVERLGEQIEANAILRRDLEQLEARDTLFPDLLPEWFGTVSS